MREIRENHASHENSENSVQPELLPWGNIYIDPSCKYSGVVLLIFSIDWIWVGAVVAAGILIPIKERVPIIDNIK